MKFRIHWEIGIYSDYAEIKADTIEEIKEMSKKIENDRSLDPEKNNMWSEEIK